MSMPLISISPLMGSINRKSSFTMVDFPAPFSPTRANTFFESILKERDTDCVYD